MSHSDWETDSDYRLFNPGKYAMRQLGRSVSRRARQMIQSTQNHTQQQQQQQQQQKVREDPITSPTQATHNISDKRAIAVNGYLDYEFSNIATPAYRRGPPLPSGIHRRSVSFDNIPVFPDTIPRRSTEPPLPLSIRSSIPVGAGLPSASTWNSGTVTIRSAAPSPTGRARSNSMGRRWLAGLANPLSAAIGPRHRARGITSPPQDTGRRQLDIGPLAAEALRAEQEIIGHGPQNNNNIDNDNDNGGDNGKDNYARQQTHNVFSMVMGKASTAPSAHERSAQGVVEDPAPHVTFRPSGISSGKDGQHVTPSQLQRQGSSRTSQGNNAHGHTISPSAPVSSGIFRRPSGQERHSEQQLSRSSSQKKRGNIARVIGNISRRLNRIRSNRSASQPATPAEVRQSMVDSLRRNLMYVPNEAGYELYRFVVNSAEPVSDTESLQPDSPTISRHMSSRRYSHRRNPTFPSQSYTEFRESAIVENMSLGRQDAVSNGVAGLGVLAATVSSRRSASSSQLPIAGAASPMFEYDFVVEQRNTYALQDAANLTLDSALLSAPITITTDISGESAYVTPALSISQMENGEPDVRMTNQGHDGTVSQLVKEKLESALFTNIRVSTRLCKDISAESSYGTFIRFHNSGELNDIFITEQEYLDQQRFEQQSGARAASFEGDSFEPHLAIADGDGGADGGESLGEAVPTRYTRNHCTVKQYVGDVRAARQTSARRKKDAEVARQVLDNDQAALDAALYIYKRQQKQSLAIEQSSPGKQTRPQPQPNNLARHYLRSLGSAGSAEVGGCGAGVLAAVLPRRKRDGRQEQRQSEAFADRIQLKKDEGRRRATVFGVFCGGSEGMSIASPRADDSRSLAPPPPPSEVRGKPARAARSKGRTVPTPTYLNKALPPLPDPEPERKSEPEPKPEPEMKPESETLSILVFDRKHGTLQRSRSFSHFDNNQLFESTDSNWAPDDLHVPWHKRDDLLFGKQPAEVNYTRDFRYALPADKEPPKNIRSSRAEPEPALNLLPVLGIFAGHTGAGAGSHSAPSADAGAEKRVRSGFFAGVLSKLARGRQQQQQRRHTMSNIDVAAGLEIASAVRFADQRPAAPQTKAWFAGQHPAPPHIEVRESGASLANEVYAGIASSAAEKARSSASKRIYSQVLSTLRSEDSGQVPDGASRPRAPLQYGRRLLTNGSGSSVLSSSNGSSIGSLASESASVQEQALRPRSSSANAGGWRDSAITGLTTQASTSTPSYGKAFFGDVATVPPQSPSRVRASDPVGLGIRSQAQARRPSAGADNGDERALEPSHFRHVFQHQPNVQSAPIRSAGGNADGKGVQSLPHSVAASYVVSSNGSFGDIFAAANSEYMNLYRTAFLPGLELDSPMLADREQLDYPVPANERLRQLEGAVLFGHVRTRPATAESRGAALVAMDSPISDAGTGRTQILDFAEADIRAGPASAAKCRRPSARPEIRRVSDLLWADTNAATGAIVAAATTTPGPLVGADTTQGADTNQSPDTLRSFEEALPNGSPAARLAGKAPTKFATISALDPASLQLLRSTGRASKEGAATAAAAAAANGASSAAAATLNPMLLAKLVRSSPDPRSLIYDASSQFGSMRSFAAPNSDNAAAAPSEKTSQKSPDFALSTQQPESRKVVVTDTPTPAAPKPAVDASVDKPMPSKLTQDIVSPGAAWSNELPDEQNQMKPHLATATAADPEALARASIQATLAGGSSAMAARKLGDMALTAAALEGAVPAYASSSNAQGEPRRAAIPEEHSLSLHSYVEQSKKSPHKKSVHSGRDQLNFRVSLLDRKFSATNRKSRSASLPCPKPTMPAFAATGDPAQPSALRFSDHTVAGILRPHAHNNNSSSSGNNKNRTRSFCDSPLLVQALMQSNPSSPDSQLPQWPVNVAHTAELGSVAIEDLAERALFSQLLGDGAALTSPDIGTARRQSIASPVVQPEPPLFDPEVDTGENGVPDSVLRAYLAGDLTAVERFFEHIMLITAPSSIYDGEVSEDGDWLYGLEGPPPEIIAQRKAAATKLNQLEQNINESREAPGMVDVSAEASRTIVSSVNLSEAPSMSTAHNSARVSDSQIAQAAGSLLDKVPSQMSMLSAQNTRAPPKGSQQVHQGRAFPLAGKGTGDYASDEDIVVNNKLRKIAVPRSLLPRAQRLNPQVDAQNGHSGSRQESMELISSPAVSTDIAAQQWRSNASTSITNSQPLQPAGLVFGHSDAPVSLQASAVRFSPSIVTPASASASALQSLDVVQPPASYAETASCLSPGRMPEFNRSRSRQQHSEVSHRKPIPKPTIDPKKREKMMLMARLRVLETMVQKSAIEESRLQPPPELRRPQLVDDMESMASIYSSSVVVDYGINQRELNRSAIHQHPHADDSRVFFNEKSAQGYKNGRPEVLDKLRRGSQVRALYPLRASILNRQFSAPGQGNESVSEHYYRSSNASGDRSAEAISIDVADQGVASNRPHVCNMPVLSARGSVATFSKASRFQRTNKILI